VAYPNDQSAEHQLAAGGKPRQAKRKMSGRHGADVADAGTPRPSPSECQTLFGAGWWDEGRATSECGEVPHASHYAAISDEIRRGDTAGQWWVEPNVGRVAHGVPARVDRLRSLGNAVVPQIPEIIGRAIIMNHKEDQWTPPPPKPT
jgi:DNA (cytosine-5)-methyltransferase 1